MLYLACVRRTHDLVWSSTSKTELIYAICLMQTLVNKLAAALVEAEKENSGPGPGADRISVSCAGAKPVNCFTVLDLRVVTLVQCHVDLG